MTFTGKDLIALGYEPGPHFQQMLKLANETGRCDHDTLAHLLPAEKVSLRTNSIPFANFLDPKTTDEWANFEAVTEAMDKLLRTPTIKKAAVMPDACPAGAIPVGGVVAAENAIHPGYHSADICCSMMASELKRNIAAKDVLDAAMKCSHFGPIKRPRFTHHNRELMAIMERMSKNSFLSDLLFLADRDFMTQGDGNHFFFVGDLNGSTVIVTHHGSRGLGARLYNRGKKLAVRMTAKIAKGVPDQHAWIPADTDEGRAYWEALQIVRDWTKANHTAIHNAVGRHLGVKIGESVWNEHNFVFQRTDGLFYHAKGATPAFKGFSPDDIGVTLIPMNMGREILVTNHEWRSINEEALGFAPHGAGRNMSRSSHIRRLKEKFGEFDPAQIMHDEILSKGIDARFYSGTPDVSELPSAYKDPDEVIAGIKRYDLATVVHRIQPLGSIMAGEMSWDRGR